MLKQFAVVALVVTASTGAAAGARQDAAAGAGQDASSRDQQVRARYNIFGMEGVLERAVKHGADQLRRQFRRVMPDMMIMSGEAQARGFRLDGYGVFFDVSVPVMRQTVAWSLRTFMQDSGAAALQQIKTAIERTVPDPREKATLMQAIKRLEMQVGTPVQGGGPAMAAAQRGGERGTVTALDAPPADVKPEDAKPTLTPDEAALVEDPNGAYEREVINALKDAMLDHSGSIRIGADEWLTVAAHDNEQRNRLMPGDAYDLLTIVLRVKGSDLAAYRADRITLEEARKRIIVSEF